MDETLVGLARTGVRHVIVICPGFVADCLETVDEIGDVGPNDRPRWIAAMTEIALEQLQGWR